MIYAVLLAIHLKGTAPFSFIRVGFTCFFFMNCLFDALKRYTVYYFQTMVLKTKSLSFRYYQEKKDRPLLVSAL